MVERHVANVRVVSSNLIIRFLNVMIIGDLIKHKDLSKYGIILDIFQPEESNGTYFVVLWAGRLTSDWVWDDMVEKV